MKIVINYDLLSKIQEAKTGFSLENTGKPILLKSGIGITIWMSIGAFASLTPERLIDFFSKGIIFNLSYQTIINGTVNLILLKFIKNRSKDALERLSLLLNGLNVNTDAELMLDSYKYKTEYKIDKTDNTKDIVQKKYIMVPVMDNGEEKEVSILQEHVIGSKIYSLSCGEPTKQKVFKLALNPM